MERRSHGKYPSLVMCDIPLYVQEIYHETVVLQEMKFKKHIKTL